jgi:hypothetical protein
MLDNGQITMREGHPTDEHFNALASSGKINVFDKKLNLNIITKGEINRIPCALNP